MLVFHVMPYSWQLIHFMAVTAACFMTVPEKVVNTVGEWHSSLAIALAPLGGTAGMCPEAPEGG